LVVGINTAMAGAAQGICFAIGADTAEDVAARLMRDGRVRRARLGVAGQTVMLDRRLARRLGRTAAHVIIVSEVIDGSPAKKAGLQPGDLLLTFDEQELGGVDDLHRLLTAERAGRACTLTLVRGAKLETKTVLPELKD